jgi:transcriptional regulator with XRE-family HTH domain
VREHIRPKNLAAKLRAIRKHLGVSQAGMTELLNFQGYYGRISDYELGKRQPTVLTLLAYARVAGVHIDDLVDDATDIKVMEKKLTKYPANAPTAATE